MNLRFLTHVSLVALVAGATPPARAAEAVPAAPKGGATQAAEEVVVVTATKRPRSLRSVPISVSVTDSKTIKRAQIKDLIDLQSLVPSLKVVQSTSVGETVFTIRGFGNGADNVGIEPSVGVFVDGVYRSHAFASLDDLPDVERIEVLRGPQSTLYGKNVSVGAVSVVTKPPSFTLSGEAELTLGNYGTVQSRLKVTGPVSDKVAISLFATTDNRDGYLTNVVTGDKVNNRNRQSYRGDVLVKPNDDVQFRVIADYNQIQELCCGVVTLVNGPGTNFIGALPPNGLGAKIPMPGSKFSNDIAFNQDPTNTLRGGGVSGQLDWDLGFAKLTSISAYREVSNYNDQDVDYTGADIADKTQSNIDRTTTEELRLASQGSGPWSWLVGGFYDHDNVSYDVDTVFGSQIRPYADYLSGSAASLPGHSNIYLLETLQGLITPSIVPGKTYFQPGQGIFADYGLSTNSYSVFGQTDYKITPKWTVTAGLAYLYDRKSASSDVVLTDKFSQLNLEDIPQFPLLGIPANAFASGSGLQFFHPPVNYPNPQEDGILAGDRLTYALRSSYDLGFANAYASYTTGWKAGAYNLSYDSTPPNVNGVGRTAGPEIVNVWEVGLKAKLPNGYFDVALFDQTIHGFQSDAYTGTGFALVNAGEESVRGVEIDTHYTPPPVPWLALAGGMTYLDPLYDSFDKAVCPTFPTPGCTVNPHTGVVSLFHSLSGTTPAGIARWSSYVSATVSHDFSDTISSFLRAEYDYTSATPLADNVPKNVATYGVKELNASLGFTWYPHQVDVMLWGRNLTDDRQIIAAFPDVAQAGSFAGFPNEPRTYGITLRKRF